MKVASWLRCLATSVVAMGILVAVVGVFSGCSSEKAKDKGKTPVSKPKEKETPKAKETPKEKPAEEKPAPKEKPGPEEKPAAKAEPKKSDSSPTDKVSSYAPAEDLVAQADKYLEDLEEVVASEDAFKEGESKISRYSNTLIVIALALGMHDEENKYKAAAPGMIKAAQELAAASDYATAKKAVAGLTAAAGSQGGGELKWEKVASMAELMKAVPLVRNKIKSRTLSGPRLKSKAKTYAGHAAVLAVIAQGSIPMADETEAPNEVEKWLNYCIQMRDASAALNAGIRAVDSDAAVKAMDELEQSCTDCHSVFHKDADKDKIEVDDKEDE